MAKLKVDAHGIPNGPDYNRYDSSKTALARKDIAGDKKTGKGMQGRVYSKDLKTGETSRMKYGITPGGRMYIAKTGSARLSTFEVGGHLKARNAKNETIKVEKHRDVSFLRPISDMGPQIKKSYTKKLESKKAPATTKAAPIKKRSKK